MALGYGFRVAVRTWEAHNVFSDLASYDFSNVLLAFV